MHSRLGNDFCHAEWCHILPLIDLVLNYFHVLGWYEQSGAIYDLLPSHTPSLAIMYIYSLAFFDSKKWQEVQVI